MTTQISYDNCFTPYLKQFKKITLDKTHEKKLATAVLALMNNEQKRLNRKLNSNEIENFKKTYMQIAGDVVLEQYLGLNFVDYNNITDIKKPYINKMIKDGNIDVCTFSYGYFPLVYSKTYRKTIFVCMVSKTEFYICGMGRPNIIDGYSKPELVMNERLRSYNRSGFYAFYHLDPIPDQLGKFLTLATK